LSEYLTSQGVSNARIHGNRSQAQRTEALEGFKSGRYKCLVATDIVARGIDVEQLEHVVNFDVPHLPEDYIHRVGRTARAEATGDAFTLVSPEEEQDLAAIERAIGKRLPRVVVPGFDYASKPQQRFEVPIAERIAEIRARKAEERRRAKEKAERRAANAAGSGRGSAPRTQAPSDSRGSRGPARNDGAEAKREGGKPRRRGARGGRPRGGQGGGGGHSGRSDGPYR
jgi:ATP-dependent RNA helicase RhlE